MICPISTSLLAALLSGAASDGTVFLKFPANPVSIPELELSGRLGQTLSVSHCEAISGLTCSISLKDGAVLPSKIYFAEAGSDGKQSSPEFRLIYPDIKPGETGRATFRWNSTSAPSRLILHGVWSQREKTD